MNKAMLYEGKDTASLIFSKPKNQGKKSGISTENQ